MTTDEPRDDGSAMLEMPSPTRATPPKPWARRLWTAAQVGALLVTAVLLVGLVLAPERALGLAWYAIVPILPASFLINAGLWRGVCPIATANTIWPRQLGRVAGPTWLRVTPIIGIGLLVLLVPARRLILNTNGPVLAALLVAIVVASLVLGRIFRTKAGFCNSLCPILPVEKLYGQSPLVWVQNPRCVPCNQCSVKGCMDLSPPSAVSRRNGQGSGRKWTRTPMGLFASAFPGFVLGYFLTTDGGLADWASVYGTVLGPAVASLAIFGGGTFLFDIPARKVAVTLAAVAVGLYYWYAMPASVAYFGGPEVLAQVLRGAALALVAVWFLRAFPRR